MQCKVPVRIRTQILAGQGYPSPDSAVLASVGLSGPHGKPHNGIEAVTAGILPWERSEALGQAERNLWKELAAMPSLVFGAFLFAQPLHACSHLSSGNL